MVYYFINFCIISIFLADLASTQLSLSDSNHIISLINAERDEKSGLYGKDLDSTYKSVYSLKVLGEDIKDIPKICKEIGYVSSRTPTKNIVLLDELLNCKNDISKIEQTNNINSLSEFYDNLVLALKNNISFDFTKSYVQLQAFQNKNKLFFESNDETNTARRTYLIQTTKGLKTLALLYSKLQKKEQDFVIEDIKTILKYIDSNHYHTLNNVILNNYFRKSAFTQMDILIALF